MYNYHYYSSNFNSDETTRLNPSSANNQREEYEQYLYKKKLAKTSGVVELTSKELIKEYNEKNNYFTIRLFFILFISCLQIFDSILEFKYLKPNELNIIILIMSLLSAAIIILLLTNLYTKVLLNEYIYIIYYSFSIAETFIFWLLFTFKSYAFYFLFDEFYKSKICHNKISCPKKSLINFFLYFNAIIIILILLSTKFIIKLFFEGINILFKKEKTLFQKQFDLNMKNNKNKNNNKNNEFIKDKKNSDKTELNSKDKKID